MRIAGRLALQSADDLNSLPDSAGDPTRMCGYHGVDVIVHALSEHIFEAELAADLPLGALVRLRLPGAGMMVAHVERSRGGHMRGKFVNPVSAARLGKTLGYAQAA